MELCWNLGAGDWVPPSDAAALQQSWAYGAAIAAMGGQVLRARAAQGNVLQVVIRSGRLGRLASLHRPGLGPIPARDVLSSLPGRGAKALLFTPESDVSVGLPLYSAAHMAEIALGAEPQMRARMHGKWRNRLVRAEAARLRITHSRDPGILVALLEREAGQQRAKRYRNLPARFIANWVRCDPRGFLILQAWMGPELAAEMLFLDHAPGATYQAGWTSGAGRTFSAHHLLLWRAMVHFAKKGRSRLDLGQLDTVRAPGLARFKLGSGAAMRRLGQTRLILPGPPLPRFRLSRAGPV